MLFRESQQYASFRPNYPAELFNHLVSMCTDRVSAWDCATGTGQAAVALAKHFDSVAATDLSKEQIQHAQLHERIRYTVQSAESTTFLDQSFDLVTVAQALHWFDHPTFFAEVKRVLKPGGILAYWGYSWFQVSPEFDHAFDETVLAPLTPFWSEKSKILWSGYAEIHPPFLRLQCPPLVLQVDWTLEKLMGYVQTWSATQLAERELGPRFMPDALHHLIDFWSSPGIRTVRMPLVFHAFRNE
jgi:SAM-dependent methyltransferase